MLKGRYYIRLFSAFFSRFKGVILLSLVVGTLFFVTVFILLPVIGIGGGSRIGITGKFTSDTLPPQILDLIGDGLTRVDESGIPLPNLAETWESQDGGKSWTFKLKDGITWQDGQLVKSNDIAYNFANLAVDYPAPNEIVFNLETQLSSFPSIVTKPVFKKGLLGTGEWQVTKIVLANEAIQHLTIKNAGGEKLIYKFYPSEERTRLALKLGEVDRIDEIYKPNEFANWKTLTVTPNVDYNKVVGLFFNTESPLFADKSVRQAIAYAINKEAFGPARAIGPISSKSWVYNPQVKPYDYDLAHAKQLLGEISEERKANMTFTLHTYPILLDLAEKVAEDIRALGFTVDVKLTTGDPSESFTSLLAILDIPKDPDQYAFWHSTQVTSNITKFQNPRIDKLLEDGRTELDQVRRKELYFDFQRFLVEESPAVFMYYPTFYSIGSD